MSNKRRTESETGVSVSAPFATPGTDLFFTINLQLLLGKLHKEEKSNLQGAGLHASVRRKRDGVAAEEPRPNQTPTTFGHSVRLQLKSPLKAELWTCQQKKCKQRSDSSGLEQTEQRRGARHYTKGGPVAKLRC